ncbi:HEPN domain-containing protein [candidate division WOR-3 bacterium]|nr:HEPN domain-containing protein [candidate division WOR-3 bacterium]
MKEWEKHLERAGEKLKFSQFGLPFVNEGLIEDLYAKSLAKAETTREKADYDIYYEPSKEEAESTITDADAFLKRIEAAIEKIT